MAVPLYALSSSEARIRLGDAHLTRTTTGLPALEEASRELIVEREIPVQGWVVVDSHGSYTNLGTEKVKTWGVCG